MAEGPPLLERLPTHLLNGITVATGIAAIQALVLLTADAHSAQLVLGGAVCASLADTPNPAARTLRRVSAAGLAGLLGAAVVALLRSEPLALGAAIAAIGFLAMMSMAWGVRAAPVSFAPILALVFTLAIAPQTTPVATLVAWHAAGAVAYLGWALLAASLLRSRYRARALAAAFDAGAALLASRARLLDATTGEGRADPAAELAWIGGEAAMAERLQRARDFVFDAAESVDGRRETALLLQLIELRDMLLASRLDLELLGDDAAGRGVRATFADALREAGARLHGVADGLRSRRRSGGPPQPADPLALRLGDAGFAAGDPRGRLLEALRDRLADLDHTLAHTARLLHGGDAEVLLAREQLLRFVAPEGWPLRALTAQLTWQSPVLRHALRTALALGSAYALALALPWASHPHWLVLSVAVVLRTNLDQTLSRRNARVLGTLLGCALVLLLSLADRRLPLELVFLVSIAIAHAYVLERYWLTAAAATVMALLQAHLVDPAAGFAIGERVADTLLGAALAWAFGYVLPSWERRHLPRAVELALNALRDYTRMAIAADPADPVTLRLARRLAYDALGELAGAMQRSAVEPRAVRLPLNEVAALLDHGQRLLAHVSMIRLTWLRRGAELQRPAARAAVAAAAAELAEWLDLRSAAAASSAGGPTAADPLALPEQSPAQDLLPWLQRRLALLLREAASVRAAANAAMAPRR